jgi:hypothetical protein
VSEDLQLTSVLDALYKRLGVATLTALHDHCPKAHLPEGAGCWDRKRGEPLPNVCNPFVASRVGEHYRSTKIFAVAESMRGDANAGAYQYDTLRNDIPALSQEQLRQGRRRIADSMVDNQLTRALVLVLTRRGVSPFATVSDLERKVQDDSTQEIYDLKALAYDFCAFGQAIKCCIEARLIPNCWGNCLPFVLMEEISTVQASTFVTVSATAFRELRRLYCSHGSVQEHQNIQWCKTASPENDRVLIGLPHPEYERRGHPWTVPDLVEVLSLIWP